MHVGACQKLGFMVQGGASPKLGVPSTGDVGVL